LESWRPQGPRPRRSRRFSFNSATTLESWRHGRRGSRALAAAGFNSATTLESWRRKNSSLLHQWPSSLQFGHDVGVVETCFPRGYYCISRRLQFGHDVGVVETYGLCNCSRHDHDASIRPRRWSRGDAVRSLSKVLRIGIASIRPRRWSRGDPTTKYQFLADEPTLQFGHDVGVVETRQVRVMWLPGRQGFNSATTLESWRLEHNNNPVMDWMSFNSATTLESWRP